MAKYLLTHRLDTSHFLPIFVTLLKQRLNSSRRPTGQKQQLFDGKKVKNEGKLILAFKECFFIVNP